MRNAESGMANRKDASRASRVVGSGLILSRGVKGRSGHMEIQQLHVRLNSGSTTVSGVDSGVFQTLAKL